MPIDLETIDSFDPFKVPTLSELCETLERCDLINVDKKIKGKSSDHYGYLNNNLQVKLCLAHFQDYKKADMKQYIEYFENFLNKGKMEA